MELTVGYVAGIVAAAFFIARLLSPNALVLIISWCLSDKPTAGTLTVASTAFQKSHWSTLLSSDSSQRHGVSKSVLWTTRLIPLMSLLLGLGAVVTPIGLYSALVPGEAVVTNFVYASDPSPFGYGTPPRSSYSWSRLCGGSSFFDGPRPCPFSESVSIVTHYPNGTVNFDYPYNISSAVPPIIVDTFSSGTSQDTTVSNFFDIQWRRYSTKTSRLYDNESHYLTADNRNIESLILTEKLHAVEGLVVDAVDGGVGFRNHTIPPGFAHGAQWSEDLLFVQPETVCVDTNLTLDFSIIRGSNSSSEVSGLVLTDRGGFVNMNRTYPRLNLTDPQSSPDLWARAYKAAWLHNAYTAMYFNVTNPTNDTSGLKAWSYMNSDVGKTFALDDAQVSGIDGLNALTLSSDFGSYVQGISNGTGFNPWRITSNNYSIISVLCSGSGNGDFANITNILVACGQMRSVPQRVSPGSNLIMEDGSSWTQKIYTCATATRATVKTVDFTYNSTDENDRTLTALTVDSVRDKNYATLAAMPLWGTENLGNGYDMTELNLVWGLVSDKEVGNANVSVVRQPGLYLPGFFDPDRGGAYTYGDGQNLPGSDFSIGALVTAYTVAGSSSQTGSISSDTAGGVDYTGRASLAMWARWQNLTGDASTASRVPNLIFTDGAASTVVGTKGAPARGASSPAVRVTPTVLRVRYHLPYAIPALICAALLLAMLAAAAASAALSGGGGARLRRQLNQLSAGRIYTTLLYPGLGGGDMRQAPRDWSRRLGDKVVDLTGPHPVPGLLVPIGVQPPPSDASGASDGRPSGAEDEEEGRAVGMGMGMMGGEEGKLSAEGSCAPIARAVSSAPSEPPLDAGYHSSRDDLGGAPLHSPGCAPTPPPHYQY